MTTSTAATNGLTSEAVIATLIYITIGIVMMMLAVTLVNWMFQLNMKKELANENNVAYGVMIAGFFIAVAIIIAGTIMS